ncbi:MAG: hypothetical protein K0U72_13495 [Gammaproteobacteria bacterium]|nr:hypothetical protein [Gammaproteobacteria bacterium]
MHRGRLKDWLEIIGMTAIVASLVFVGLQLQQDQRIAATETYGDVAGSSLHIAEILQGRGELWRRGLDGAELSAGEQIEFGALATAVEAWFVMNWSRSSRLGTSNPDAMVRDYAFALYCHPGLRQHHDSELDRVRQTDTAFGEPVEFGAFPLLVEDHLKRLASRSAAVPESKSYIFWN